MVNPKLAEQQSYSVNVCDLGIGIMVQDQSSGAIDDKSVPVKGQRNAKDTKSSGYRMMVDESITALTIDEEQANETKFSSSIHRSARHVSGKKWLYFSYF